MSQKSTLLRGTFILTAAGFATKIIGFFYRIFLSRCFGEEAVGLYQLIFPVYALVISLCCAGIQTAVARAVAEKIALGRPEFARRIFALAAALSFLLSMILLVFIQKQAGFLAVHILREPRCESLLVSLAPALPFAAVHSCVCGYYMGQKEPAIPALSQLAEQLARVLFTGLLYYLSVSAGRQPGISIAVTGLAAGELVSMVLSGCLLLTSLPCGAGSARISGTKPPAASIRTEFHLLRELLSLSVPLTASRVLLNLLQSIEAISIPLRLRESGMTAEEALRIYGVLTGMALPCILFPSAATNALSAMMLPAIAGLQAAGNKKAMNDLIRKAVGGCLLLGMACCIGLLLTGRLIGRLLFHSETAGSFLLTLAWICPFLYTTSCLISIINGLGKTGRTLLFHSISLSIRIFSILFLIPQQGIVGYLRGLLFSQLVLFLLCIFCLKRATS